MPRSHTDDTVRQKGQEEGAGSTPKHLAPPRGLPGEGRGTHGRNVPERAMTAGPWAGCRYINSCWVPGGQCPRLRDPCGLQDGCTASTGRAGLRVPAELLNSLKYNQPLSRPASCWGRAEILPSPPARAPDQDPGGDTGRRSPDWLLGKEAGRREGAAGTGATPPSSRRCSCHHHCHRRGRTQPARSSGALAKVSPPGGQHARPLACWGGGRPQLRATVAGWGLLSHVLSPNLHPREVCKALVGGGGVPILQLSVPL